MDERANSAEIAQRFIQAVRHRVEHEPLMTDAGGTRVRHGQSELERHVQARRARSSSVQRYPGEIVKRILRRREELVDPLELVATRRIAHRRCRHEPISRDAGNERQIHAFIPPGVRQVDERHGRLRGAGAHADSLLLLRARCRASRTEMNVLVDHDEATVGADVHEVKTRKPAAKFGRTRSAAWRTRAGIATRAHHAARANDGAMSAAAPPHFPRNQRRSRSIAPSTSWRLRSTSPAQRRNLSYVIAAGSSKWS